VNTQPTASLSLSQPEVRYHKIGDKVVQQDSATLVWSAGNASQVTVNPVGSVSPTGSQTITATPDRNGDGPINEDVTYTLKATNACGGTATRSATLHIVGSIDPPPPVTLASVFYPTAYPEKEHPQVGLVASQQQLLAKAANTFKNNAQYDQGNKLMVVGHADVRGSEKYNLALSERRDEIVKEYLISQGIAPDRIETRAEGKDKELDQKKVEALQSEDTEKAPGWMSKNEKATWLAYNRRVDIILEPTGQESTEAYPNDAGDARILWQLPAPKLNAVETALSTPATGQSPTMSAKNQ
jgi:OmpA family